MELVQVSYLPVMVSWGKAVHLASMVDDALVEVLLEVALVVMV